VSGTAVRVDRLRQVARVGIAVLRDRVAPARPLAPPAAPASAADVTPQWLTAVLCRGRGARVVEVRHERISRGTSGHSRLRLRYEGGPGIEELPATVFAKHAPGLGNRLQVGVTGAIRAEIRFYRDVRPLMPGLRAPQGYGGASERTTGRAIVLLEDMDRTRPDVRYGDIRTVYTTRSMAESMVDNLAVLHGSFLGSQRLDQDLRWIITSAALQHHLNAAVDIERRTLVGFDRARDVIPAALHRHRKYVQPGLMKALTLDERVPNSIVHTDVHAGNWFVEDGDRMGLYDWAATARGQGARDLAYALTSALTVADRRAWERDLVAHYTEQVAEVSGTAQDHMAVWTAYRRQVLHGFGYWLYTLGRGALQPKMQPDEVSRTNIERMAQAVHDLQTFAALAKA
jgi:hypothetical protein